MGHILPGSWPSFQGLFYNLAQLFMLAPALVLTSGCGMAQDKPPLIPLYKFLETSLVIRGWRLIFR